MNSTTHNRQLFLGNAWRMRGIITDALTGERKTGLTVRGFFADSPTSLVAIHGELDTTLTEVEDGEYEAVLDGLMLRTRLTAYVGQVIYERHVSDDGDHDTFLPVTVIEGRRANDR